MGQVTSKTNLSTVASLEDLRRFVSIALTDIATQINGKLIFGQNVSAQVIPVTLALNTPTQVPHSLGRVPLMWVAGSFNTSANVWETQGPSDSSLYLEADANVTLSVLVI